MKDYYRHFHELIICFIAVVLLFLGLYMENNFLIELAVIALVIEIVIRRITGKILYRDIQRSIRDVIGITDPNSKVFPELLQRIEENAFHVIDRRVVHAIKYGYPRKKELYNMYSRVYEYAEVIPKSDNINFTFKRMIPENIPNPKIEKIECVENELKEEFNLNDPHAIIHFREGSNVYYKILKPLKKNHRYKFTIISKTPLCLSDLNFREKEDNNKDWIGCELIMPTQSLGIIFKFPFDIKKYKFYIKRQNFSRTDIRVISPPSVEFNYKNNRIKIKQENLEMGDLVTLYWEKKKS